MARRQAEWNAPSRSDYYLMQIACEVRRVLRKNPESIKLDSFKIPFEFETSENPETAEGYTKEEIRQMQMDAIKSRWMRRVRTGGSA